jgi:hypothetical protein
LRVTSSKEKEKETIYDTKSPATFRPSFATYRDESWDPIRFPELMQTLGGHQDHHLAEKEDESFQGVLYIV